jgi:hypothetical protein
MSAIGVPGIVVQYLRALEAQMERVGGDAERETSRSDYSHGRRCEGAGIVWDARCLALDAKEALSSMLELRVLGVDRPCASRSCELQGVVDLGVKGAVPLCGLLRRTVSALGCMRCWIKERLLGLGGERTLFCP